MEALIKSFPDLSESFKNGHSRSSGNVLNQPLDFGFRRNDGVARIKAIRLPVCVYRFVVIPAKAGIQEGDDGVPQEMLIQSDFTYACRDRGRVFRGHKL